MNTIYKLTFYIIRWLLLTYGSMYLAGQLCMDYCSGEEFIPMIKTAYWVAGTGIAVGGLGLIHILFTFLDIKIKVKK